MNERIRELASEADRLWAGASPEDPEWCEKFAELIVEECCTVLSKETIQHSGYGFNQHALYKQLRRHFGVER